MTPWSLFIAHIDTFICLLTIHMLISSSLFVSLCLSVSCSCILLEVLLSYTYTGTQNTTKIKDLHILISLVDFYLFWRALKPEKALNINSVALYPTREYLFS